MGLILEGGGSVGKFFNNDTVFSFSLSLSLHLTPNVHIKKKHTVGSQRQSHDILISAVFHRSFIICEGTSLIVKRHSHSESFPKESLRNAMSVAICT